MRFFLFLSHSGQPKRDFHPIKCGEVAGQIQRGRAAIAILGKQFLGSPCSNGSKPLPPSKFS